MLDFLLFVYDIRVLLVSLMFIALITMLVIGIMRMRNQERKSDSPLIEKSGIKFQSTAIDLSNQAKRNIQQVIEEFAFSIAIDTGKDRVDDEIMKEAIFQGIRHQFIGKQLESLTEKGFDPSAATTLVEWFRVMEMRMRNQAVQFTKEKRLDNVTPEVVSGTIKRVVQEYLDKPEISSRQTPQ